MLMMRIGSYRLPIRAVAVAVAVIWSQHVTWAQSAPTQVSLELDPAESKIDWTLSATFHTVHGTFALTKGNVQFYPGTGKLDGEITADARSGQSGDSGRDRNMHEKVIESGKYPAVTFSPDRVDGKIALQGGSKVQLHGIFEIHGEKHELIVPAEVNFSGDRWTAKSVFEIPYVQWGMKNPSNFFLHVGDTVKIELELTGRAILPRTD
ncbi:MAG TPA: YceI family protein [Candidatus Acidoferrales bacterium]|nr:YceI family protein [Candidatus Acidoferrales bacterium]